MRALLAAWMVIFAHEGKEFVIALPAVMLAAAFFLMRYAAGGKSEDEPAEGSSEESETPTPSPDPPAVGVGHR